MRKRLGEVFSVLPHTRRISEKVSIRPFLARVMATYIRRRSSSKSASDSAERLEGNRPSSMPTI